MVLLPAVDADGDDDAEWEAVQAAAAAAKAKAEARIEERERQQFIQHAYDDALEEQLEEEDDDGQGNAFTAAVLASVRSTATSRKQLSILRIQGAWRRTSNSKSTRTKRALALLHLCMGLLGSLLPSLPPSRARPSLQS